MSFRACYAVIDAAAKCGALTGEWGFIFWVARHLDDSKMVLLRSQARLGKELGVTDRQIRRYIEAWQKRGVLHRVSHGGGRQRAAALWRVDLAAFDVVVLKALDHRVIATTKLLTPDASTRPELSPGAAIRTS